MENEQACQPDQRSIWQRCVDKIFPYRFNEGRDKFWAKGNGKGLTTTTFICLDWPDRIRIVFGGVIKVDVTTNTEHEPGKAESCAFVNVRPPGIIPEHLQVDPQ